MYEILVKPVIKYGSEKLTWDNVEEIVREIVEKRTLKKSPLATYTYTQQN
jgi:hypothetical protein